MDRRTKFRIFLAALYCLIFSCILYLKIVPSGKALYHTDFRQENAFISRITPAERVRAKDRELPNIIAGNPVYFNLFTPRPFDRAILNIRFKNPDKLPLFEAGILSDKDLWRYDLKPVQNIVLDDLSLVWEKSLDKGILFLQNTFRPEVVKYENADKMLEATEDYSRVATYKYEPGINFTLKDYASGTDIHEIGETLAGAYEIYTYINGEELYFEFDFANLENDPDKESQVKLFLTYQGELLKSLEHRFAAFNDKANLELKEKNLGAGVYAVEIKTGDKVITQKIRTVQNKHVFKNRINFAKSGQGPVEVWTDSNNLQARTIYPDSLQTIEVDGQGLSLSETYKLFNKQIFDLATSSGLKHVVIGKDGVFLSGDGYFSLGIGAYFKPGFTKVDKYFSQNIKNIDYVLADYQTPEYDNYSYLKKVEFDLKKAYRENGNYSFLFSVPDLELGESSSVIEIEEISIELSGKTLGEKLKQIFYER